MNLVVPCNTGNAIKVAAFAFEFSERLEKNLVHQILELCESDQELSKQFPQCEKHRSMDVDAGNGDITTWTSGAAFSRLTSTAQLDWSFIISHGSIVVNCATYTRWDEVFPEVKRILNKVTSLFPIKQKVGVVGLEYVDEFHLTQGKSTDWANELFREHSKYLPCHVKDLDDYWHFNHGFFQDSDSDKSERILNSLVINLVADNKLGLDIVRITTTHKSKLSGVCDLDSNFIENTAQDLIESSHTLNKVIIKDLLSDDVCVDIKLEVD